MLRASLKRGKRASDSGKPAARGTPPGPSPRDPGPFPKTCPPPSAESLPPGGAKGPTSLLKKSSKENAPWHQAHHAKMQPQSDELGAGLNHRRISWEQCSSAWQGLLPYSNSDGRENGQREGAPSMQAARRGLSRSAEAQRGRLSGENGATGGPSDLEVVQVKRGHGLRARGSRGGCGWRRGCSSGVGSDWGTGQDCGSPSRGLGECRQPSALASKQCPGHRRRQEVRGPPRSPRTPLGSQRPAPAS